MVVHDGAVPKRVIGIGASTVMMAFVSQFLKWNLHSLKKKTLHQEANLWLCSLLNESYTVFHTPQKSENQDRLNTQLLLWFQYCMISSYTNTRLNGNSIQSSAPRGNWNVTPLYILSLLRRLQRKYCSFPFFSFSLCVALLTATLSVPLLPPQPMCVCIFHYISAMESHPAGRNPYTRSSCCRAPRLSLRGSYQPE